MMCAKAEYAASRIVNINVAINPFLYAIMKPSYRRGYWNLLEQGIKCLSFGLFNEKTMEGKQTSRSIINVFIPLFFIHSTLLIKITKTILIVMEFNIFHNIKSNCGI